MNRINFLYFIPALIVLFSCGRVPEDIALEEVEFRLRPSDIFKYDSAVYFLSWHRDANKELSLSYYKKAESELQTNLSKAVYYYKKSISLNPIESTYKRLGDVLADNEKYADAVTPYLMLVKLDEKQSEDDYKKMIRTALLSGKSDEKYEFVSRGDKLEYDLKKIAEEIIHDKKVQAKLNSQELTGFISYMRGFWDENYYASDTSLGTYSGYQEQFNAIKPPLTIGEEELQQFDYSGVYDYEYEPSMDFSRFIYERTGESGYYCVVDPQWMLGGNATYTAMIYAADTSAHGAPGDFRCIYHRLVTYDPNGVIIDSEVIGVHAGEDLRTYQIKDNTTIVAEDYARVWNKRFDKEDKDNEIFSRTLKGRTTFSISGSGEIKSTGEIVP